jgi:ribosomal protein S18 acetylase RimI-like enzyme
MIDPGEQVNFRTIEPTDIPALFAVRIATWENDHGKEELAALGITEGAVRDLLACGSHRGWLCEVDGDVVGFAMGNQETGELWVIAVLPEYEGRGIGRRLMERVEEWLSSRRWKRIWLTTHLDDRHRAVGFYRNLGWKDWKTGSVRYMKKDLG